MGQSLRAAIALVSLAAALAPTSARADELFVGGDTDPYATPAEALADAAAGDVVTVRPGTYEGELVTQAPDVTLQGDDGDVVLTADGRVIDVQHDGFTVRGVIVDGQFGAGDGIRVDADGFTLDRSEVRNAGRDCIDLRNVSDVLIESSQIHHCLRSTRDGCDAGDCREDAHAIVGGAVRGLVIRGVDIHTFSGDAFQADPGRSDAGWSDVTIERCRIWSEPLTEAVGGFAAGVNPAENAVDTKTSNAVETPAELRIVDSEVWGFGGGLISNMAAFNLKENVRALVDRVEVYDSEIGFRIRGATDSRPRGAQVTARNVVMHDLARAVRYEDGLDTVTLQNVTFGDGIGEAFDDQSDGGPSTIDAHNVLLLGDSLPAELGGDSNLAAGAGTFADVAMDDYHLADGSLAIDRGQMLPEVTVDIERTPRPQGPGWDVGAYEHCRGACSGLDAGPGTDTGSGTDAGMDGRDDGCSTDDDCPGSSRCQPGTGICVVVDEAPRDGGTIGGGNGGCGCGASGAGGGGAGALAVLLLLAHWRRRRC